MGIVKSYSFIFEDEDWVSKILIGSLITWIPIINFAVLGYSIKISQNVAHGNLRPLPSWEDFGDHFRRGLHLILISLVYSLPFGILLVVVEIFMILVATTDGSSSRGISALDWLHLLIIILLMLGLIPPGFAAMGRYVVTGRLSAAFEFGEVLAMVIAKPGLWLRPLLDGIIDAFIASLGLSISLSICGAVGIFTTFIALCAWGYQFGDLALQQGNFRD